MRHVFLRDVDNHNPPSVAGTVTAGCKAAVPNAARRRTAMSV